MHESAPHCSKQAESQLPAITLPPLGMETVDLGEFESTQLIPHLSFTYTPATSADVTPQVVRSTVEDGGVRVVVHLQNFGSQPVTVTISEDRKCSIGRLH